MTDLISDDARQTVDAVRFFSALRDLVAGGFWSSKIGVKDIGYIGNVPTQWDGAPQAVLDTLGLKYDA